MSETEQTEYEIGKAGRTVAAYLGELPSTDIDVLDFGCGWGGETLWLAKRVRSATGVDTEAGSVEHARRMLEKSGIMNCRFECAVDGRLPFADASFDAVVSTDTFEHVLDLDLAFSEIWRVLRPGGALLSRFGPLFWSPQGYHLYWACQVPLAHLLFGLDAILDLREARSGSSWRATSWEEMGLNRKRFRDFKASALRPGFEIVRFAPIPVRGLLLLARAPLVGDLFLFGVDCHLRKGADVTPC